MSIPSADLSGKYCLITGATSGIGEMTATAIAARGAHVTIICRSRAKGEALLERLTAVASAPVDMLVADLASQADIRQVAQQYLDSGKPLQLLINNAGIVNTKRRQTVDGIEETFAVNHLAYFLITNLLLERIKSSAPARIVNVASEAYKFVRDMGFDDLNADTSYKTFKVYGRSKLGNILFTQALSRRLENTQVTVNCLHPGAVSTGLGGQNDGALKKLLPLLLKPFFKTPEKGAETSLYVALSPALEEVSGLYFSDCQQARLKPWGRDQQAAEQLWQISAELTGLDAGASQPAQL